MDGSRLMYLGTSKGVAVLRSADGERWEVAHRFLGDWEVPKVAVQRDQPSRIVAGTRGDGVWVSEDFGATWKKPGRGIVGGPGKVQCVAIDSRDENTIYAGTEPVDLFVSRDGGQHWLRFESIWDHPEVAGVYNPGALVEPYLRCFVQDPHVPSTLYATLHVGFIMRSIDDGENWTVITDGLDGDIHGLAVDPARPGRWVVASGGDFARNGKAPGRALYLTEDSGEAWMPVAMDFPQDYAQPLIRHPRHADVLYSYVAQSNPSRWVGREGGAQSVLLRTMDGGQSWSQITAGLDEMRTTFFESMAFDEDDPDHVYAGLRNGDLYASQDGGESWRKLDFKLDAAISDIHCVRE